MIVHIDASRRWNSFQQNRIVRDESRGSRRAVRVANGRQVGISDRKGKILQRGTGRRVLRSRLRASAKTLRALPMQPLPSPAEQRRDIRRGNKGRRFLTDASPIFSLHRREGTRATFDAAPGGNDATRAVALALQHFHIRKERFPPPSSPPPHPLLDMQSVVNKTSGRQRRGNNDAPATARRARHSGRNRVNCRASALRELRSCSDY